MYYVIAYKYKCCKNDSYLQERDHIFNAFDSHLENALKFTTRGGANNEIHKRGLISMPDNKFFPKKIA